MSDKSLKYQIRIHESRSPRPYQDDQNLWDDELRRIYRLVSRHRQAVATAGFASGKEEDPEHTAHLSVAIFGPSGSGKSSLLRTLHHDVNRPHDGICKKLSLHDNVTALPVIDPTTWSKTDQFLYAFLAVALEEERKRQEKRMGGPPRGLSPVQMAFQEVNEYLRVIDDQERSEEYDPLGLSLQKLERHTSGIRLRDKISRFIEELARELGTDVILLLVDDLDMAPDHLVDSLETYQSFLTHPQLIPVFTFTDRTAEELIEVFFDKKLESRRQRADDQNALSISEKLSVQFLSRCFPVRNRIRLGAAPARVQRANVGIQPEEDGSRETEITAFELLVTGSFLLFGYPDQEDAHKVRAALRPSTLRRQIQVLDALADCRLEALRAPQLFHMAALQENSDRAADELARKLEPGTEPESWKVWLKNPQENRLVNCWLPEQSTVKVEDVNVYERVIDRLHKLEIGASWGSLFNGAVWSMLNVHRDILRELGLFLEDLYSWHPKELRSYVLNKILEKDEAVQRTLVDRWFNRTDYRRSQVLSLLAANMFRPWMPGEEPYGDDESALRHQTHLEKNSEGALPAFDQELEDASTDEDKEELRAQRISFRSVEGLLWFLDVTLGFYLPQIMARNWSDGLPQRRPVKERMGGNGWDLARAPINAARIADERQEAFAFGMMYLDPVGYRKALESGLADGDNTGSCHGHLLLRLWTCCGCSRGRYWAALSFWRGLGFIGEVIQLRLRHEKVSPQDPDEKKSIFVKDCSRLIRAHCLAGLVPGSFLGRDTDDEKLLRGFPKWDPRVPKIANEIKSLAKALHRWLEDRWQDRVFPMPAGEIWIDWGDCFVRRIHGEYILGALWPRMNAAYLEELDRNDELSLKRLEVACQRSSRGGGDWEARARDEDNKKFLWTADQAVAVWSEILLEYWRGCPALLGLFKACPVFCKSNLFVEIPKDFAIERVRVEDFSWNHRLYHEVNLAPVKVDTGNT